MSLVRNERIKLVAGALNTVGVATVVTAIIVSSVGFVHNPSWPLPSQWLLVAGSVWLAVGLGLQLLAIATLGRVRP